MSDKKKKILPAAEIDKAINKLIKSAVESMTQLGDALPSGCLARKIIQLKPAQVTSFSYGALDKIIREKMPLRADCMIKLCDAFVTTYPDDVFMNFMEYSNLISLGSYISEQFDCDDYSVAFCGNARKWHARIRLQLESVAGVRKLLPPAIAATPDICVIPHAPSVVAEVPAADTQYVGGSPIGMCHGKLSADSGMHAFNFWVSSKGEIVFIEPQTGEFITPGVGAFINFVYI
jgi:hypothetical protein